MAYFPKEKKQPVQEALKKIIPKSWKWSLSIQDAAQLTLTISEGDVKLTKNGQEATDFQLNHSRVDRWSGNKESETLMQEIVKIVTGDWYTKVQFGKYDKPFKSVGDKYHYHTPIVLE